MEKNNNWLKDLNEIKLLELNINFIVNTFTKQTEKYFKIKGRKEIEDLIRVHLSDIEENQDLIKTLSELTNEKLFELYILLGINFLEALKEDFKKNYL